MGSRRHTHHAHRPAERGAAVVVLAVLLSAGATGCDLAYRLERESVFPVTQLRARPPRAVIDGESWWLDVEGGQVEAIYLPRVRAATPEASLDDPGPAVIFAHGNREQVDDYLRVLEPYREMGFAVLLPEYRGYGASSGSPSEASIEEDFTYFYDRLSDRPEIDAERIVLHGRSLGGGVVGVLSGRRRPAALILESTFTNLPDLASRWFAPSAFVVDRFDTREVLTASTTPTLILHGVDDTMIPFRHAVELHRVAWESELIAYRAGHNDLPRSERAYFGPIRRFLMEAGVLPARPSLTR